MGRAVRLRQLPGAAGAVALLISIGCSASQAQVASEAFAAATPQANVERSSVGWTLKVERVPHPGADGGASPQLTTQGDRTILSWFNFTDEGTSLMFTERTPTGWSEPRVVVSGTDIIVSGADVPSVRALADGTLVAHWLQEDGPNPEAYKLPLAWSRDGGRTWSKPTTPHHDGTQSQHGFASLFQAPGGGLGVVWLDGRLYGPGVPDGPNRSMGLWVATYDRNGKQTSERAIDDRVCECCQLSAASTATGAVVAYRDRSADEVRDIYVTRWSGNQWSTPTLVHGDGWRIEGCPINGPAISVRGSSVAVAWFTAKADQGRSFVAFSRDGGTTFGQPFRVDDGASLGKVDVELLPDGSAAVSWVELAGQRSEFRVRRIEQTGSRSPAVTIANTAAMSYPRLALGKDELVFAWTDSANGPARLGTAAASLRGNLAGTTAPAGR